MDNINLDKIIKVDELDSNMILNVPEEIGEKIHKYIQSQQNSTEPISIEIIENPSESMKIEDSRKMIFNFNNELHPITILDFPCIIEAQKTIDYKTYYKGSDISQMFYVHNDKLKNEKDLINFNPMINSKDPHFNELLWKKDPDHKYKLKHGLAKCTRNIRSRRFKRKIKYNKEEILEVAKKLKNIIDNGAANYENQLNKNNTEENEDTNTVITNHNVKSIKSGKSILKNTNKKNKNKNINNNSNLLTIPLDELESNSVNNLNNNLNNNNSTLIKIDALPQITEEKQQILDKYKELKEEYVRLKEEIAKDAEHDHEKIKKKKQIKKELKALKIKYKNE